MTDYADAQKRKSDIVPPVKLSDAFRSSYNSLNVLRLIFACAVIISHSLLVNEVEVSFSIFLLFNDVPVNGFFIISGFLLAQKWKIDTSWFVYIKKRFLRIFPAFWVALLVTGFVIAPLFLILAQQWSSDYWGGSGGGFWEGPVGYFIKNSSLIIYQEGISGTPNGVIFDENWNAPLWTLPWEFFCYLTLGVIGVVWLKRGQGKLFVLITTGVLIAVGLSRLTPVVESSLFESSTFGMFIRFTTAFFIGASFALWSEKIPLNVNLFVFSSVAFLVGLMLPYTDVRQGNSIIMLPLAYIILYVGSTWRTTLFRKTDISYGVYIYAFPLQQGTVLLLGASLTANMQWFLSTLAVFVTVSVIALCSWVFVERTFIHSRYRQVSHPLPQTQTKQSLVGKVHTRHQEVPIVFPFLIAVFALSVYAVVFFGSPHVA